MTRENTDASNRNYPLRFGYALGADLLDFEAKVIDPSRDACIVVSTGGSQRAAVERKVFKVVEWYRTEADLREQGMEALLTASEFWNDFRRVKMAS